MNKKVIFLDGPIGSGKSTLGKELALRMGGQFLDGDDYSEPSLPWYTSALSTCHSIASAALTALQSCSLVIVAYPLRSREWIFFERTFYREGVHAFCVGLRASYTSIVALHRLRKFSAQEHQRIQVMIDEGYGQRPFSALIVESGESDLGLTLARLEDDLRKMLAAGEMP